jgi:hypothetical protein
MNKRIQAAIKEAFRREGISVFLLAVFTVVCAAYGQQTTQSEKPKLVTDPGSLPTAISRVERGDFDLFDVEIIARWHGVQAIPALEAQFERSTDANTKAKIANGLERLGDKKDLYWDFLADRARQVLQDEPPTPVDYDAEGAAIVDQPSERLIEWAKKHNLTIRDAAHKAMFEAPGPITDLGTSDDVRAIPILREALASENQFVGFQAALGLAELHDTNSVPLIIKACENAPKEAAGSIAQSLVYFDDPAAQHAVDLYVPKDTAQELRAARAQGKTPFR